MVSTRSSTKRKSIDDLEDPEPQTLPASTPKRQKLPLRKKTSKATPVEIPETDDGESPLEDAADETLDLDAALQAQVAAQNPDTPVLGAAEARWQAAEAEEDEESDDEAPEAVSNVQAASRAREAAEAMKKAAREEADRLRRKRKDRDVRLKEQAQSRKAKEPLPQVGPDVSAPQDAAEPEEAAPAETDRPIEERALSRPNKPETTLLPDEFLASDSEPEPESAPAPKRRKAEKKKSAAPRDKRVGDTVYRVVKGVDRRMAPKGEGRSRQVRAGLAKRGREGKERKGGFVAEGRRVDWGTSRKC